ncbi:hypothetical protein M4R23_08995 [Acidovorax sp. GBBC 3332]|nr:MULTISPECIES: hypothetical protein [unclassified Acidovorax]MDA8449819.1 hypothetical protein [Acidovorax sp. GBBC 3297]MDA8459264.1 hypothetical protein [Acidovorax sp. GBBC 3333]MDA8464301.1 hypothetical protein [Acidovorax sp. GBBC 3332]MDA8469489.1 hypothetical protein [Acidovorax sp. GBBC 3299]
MESKRLFSHLAHAALIILGVSTPQVHAEMVSVPCSDVVAVTGKALACGAIPVIKMERAAWEQEQANAAGRAERDVPPWERKGTAVEARRESTVNEQNPCDFPPWMRPQGSKKCE